MISAITSHSATQPSAQTLAAQPAPSKATAQPTTATDTVQISNAAKALLQETVENPAQTAKEARSGDRQAIRLLAKEAADKASAK